LVFSHLWRPRPILSLTTLFLFLPDWQPTSLFYFPSCPAFPSNHLSSSSFTPSRVSCSFLFPLRLPTLATWSFFVVASYCGGAVFLTCLFAFFFRQLRFLFLPLFTAPPLRRLVFFPKSLRGGRSASFPFPDPADFFNLPGLGRFFFGLLLSCDHRFVAPQPNGSPFPFSFTFPPIVCLILPHIFFTSIFLVTVALQAVSFSESSP